MQKTRQKILDYLHDHGEATVDELSEALGNLTAVTVRHHLDVLRSDGLVDTPERVQRDAPGRPKHLYRLTDKATALFPGNVRNLADHMFTSMISHLDDNTINVIFEDIAGSMASELGEGPLDEAPEDRLDRVVTHLGKQGYEASWEETERGYVLHTQNCPYHELVETHEQMCQLDMRYISRLLGTVPRRLGHKVDGQETCSYLVTFSAQFA